MAEDFKLKSILDTTKSNVKDKGDFLDETDFLKSVRDALRRLNGDKPLRKVYDITGDGSKNYPLGANWEKDFSHILSLEYPIDENPPIYRRLEDYYVYEDPTLSAATAMRLRFYVLAPTSSEKVRLKITALHSVDNTTTTLRYQDFEAVVAMGTSLCFGKLAAIFNQQRDSGIGADVIRLDSSARIYERLRDEWEDKYKRAAGLSKEVKAASVQAEKDIRTAEGDPYQWFPERHR